MKPTPAPHGRVAARAGLIGGFILAVTAIAQQWTSSPDLNCLGTLLILAGLVTLGWYAARETGALDRRAAQRSGMLAGLIAGVIGAMGMSALFLLIAIGQANTPALTVLQEQTTPATLQAQLEAFYGAEQTGQLIGQSGFTLEEYASALPRVTVAVTMACCGLGLPLGGAFLGSIGGALGRGQEPPKTEKRV